MKFKKEDLQVLLGEDEYEINGVTAKVINDEIVDNSRWSIFHDLIFKYGEQYFTTTYSVGATEYQDESPFENEPDEIECEEVIPVEVTTIKYVSKNNPNPNDEDEDDDFEDDSEDEE